VVLAVLALLLVVLAFVSLLALIIGQVRAWFSFSGFDAGVALLLVTVTVTSAVLALACVLIAQAVARIRDKAGR